MIEKLSDAQAVTLFQAEMPTMPDGYYSGDQPNPLLQAFVEAHLAQHPYDPEADGYNVPAFTTPIETTKATAIYNMHTYWSKKPHDAIRQYIRHYTQPGDLVLDSFCGSGGTALAALMEGRAAIAIDRSPAATFITKNYCTPVDVTKLRQAFDELKKKVQPEIDWLYATHCDRCGGPATIAYTVYSQVFECPRCLSRVPLFDCPTEKVQNVRGKEKEITVCPHCLQRDTIEEINTRTKKFGAIPVLVNYLCLGKCKPKRSVRRHNDEDAKKREYFEKFDLAKIREIEGKEIPHWYPKGYDMQGFSRYQRDALYYYGVKEVADLFTKRNLWALGAIKKEIEKFDAPINAALNFAFSAILFGMTRMYRWTEDGQHDIIKGTYYLPQLSREINVFLSYEDKFSGRASITALPNNLHNKICISTQDAISLHAIPTQSVDYIFTDPPYADKVQYGELNFLWEAWLGFDTSWHNDEIIVNEIRGKTEAEWANKMRLTMQECYRILKPGRWVSLCYHDTSEGTWALIQDLMTEVGFVPDALDSVLFIDSVKKSYNQNTADKITKRDLVINFRKPRAGELSSVLITGEEDEQTFLEKVHLIIGDYLAAHPGETKDRVYDEVVSRMVRAGSMETHDFAELLVQVAEPAADDQTRWFLRYEVEAKLDADSSSREEDAARIVEAFITRTLRQEPELEGVHYSNIFEHYLYTVKEKPRRHIADWLPDYFYIAPDGTYRPPVNEEEREAKTLARRAGVNRHIKRFLAYLQQGLEIPESERPSVVTLAGWIAHCCASHLYEQGQLLYERGGLDLEQLDEEQQMLVDENYQICVMRAGKEKQKQQKAVARQGQEKAKRARKKVVKETGPTLFDL